jgi:hypothetical protein
MDALAALFTPPVIMAMVATVLAMAATYVITRPALTDPAIYGRRIVGTMLGAGAIILGGFAWALQSCGPGK